MIEPTTPNELKAKITNVCRRISALVIKNATEDVIKWTR